MTTAAPSRKPRVFAPDDPALSQPTRADNAPDEGATGDPTEATPPTWNLPTASDVRRGIRWGALLLSAIASLTALAAGLAFARFVSEAIARHDWVGWTATGLLAVIIVSAAVIVLRELVGILRLSRLAHLRRDADAALRGGDVRAERQAVSDLARHFSGRSDMKWSLARLAEHQADVRDAGELLSLADRELLAPLDNAARRIILKSAKRVTMVTALMPMVWMAMLFVLVENLRLLRSLAGLYGGRPGFLGAVRLARMVMAHIIATGGIALTDDLLGQFLGQDLLRRLSRRLGEGVFNGALTARIGAAAIEVTRPLPYIEATPVRIRDLLPEIFRRSGAPQPTASASG